MGGGKALVSSNCSKLICGAVGGKIVWSARETSLEAAAASPLVEECAC